MYPFAAIAHSPKYIWPHSFIVEVGVSIRHGVSLKVGLNILGMRGIAEITPHASVLAYGELSIGILVLHASLRLEGHVVDVKFPTRGELAFNKFPLDVG